MLQLRSGSKRVASIKTDVTLHPAPTFAAVQASYVTAVAPIRQLYPREEFKLSLYFNSGAAVAASYTMKLRFDETKVTFSRVEHAPQWSVRFTLRSLCALPCSAHTTGAAQQYTSWRCACRKRLQPR